MKAHYTPQELTDMVKAGLPGLPSAKKNIIAKIKRDGREGIDYEFRGNTIYVALASLPAETRQHLAKTAASAAAQAGAVAGRKLALVKATREAAKPVLTDTDRTDSLQLAAQLSTAGQLRADAKIAILAAFGVYHQSSGEAVTIARRTFAQAYNNRQIEVEPWVRDIVAQISAATIERWQARAAHKGVIDLCGRYGNRAGSGTIDSDDDLTSFLRAFLAEFPHASSDAILRGMKAFPLFKEQNKKLPAKRSLQRWLQQWKANNTQMFDKMDDPVGWSQKWLVSHGKMAADVTEPNQRWESDSSPADIILGDGKRYTLLATVDVAPRRVRVLLSSSASSAATGLLMRRCIIDFGVPTRDMGAKWHTDNGSEYRARYIQRVVADLDIEQHFCHVRSPWEKPFVESFFRTLAHGVFELLPGFIGHSVAERKKIEGRKFVKKFMTRGETVELDMTFDQLHDWLNEWVDNIYQHNYHSGIKMSPFQWMANWRGAPIKQIADVRALDMLLMPLADRGGIRDVTARGIQVDNGTFIAPELALWTGRKVRVYLDPDDIGQIVVYSACDPPEFVCVAVDASRPDISRPEFAAKARAMQKMIDTEITDIRKTAKKMGMKNIMDHIRHDAAEAAGKLSYLPHARQDYITPALEAAAEARAALDGTTEPAMDEFIDMMDDARERFREMETQRDTKVVALPTAHRPMFGTDLEKYQWLKGNPILNIEDDAAWLVWYENTTEYRLMFGGDEEAEQN